MKGKNKMALPKLSVPYYTLKLISGKEIKYRPFLVKEEKALLMANESEDSKMIVNTIKNTVSSCISSDTPLDMKYIPLYELEWLILNIRMKSVGESAKFQLKCPQCEKMVPCNLDMTKIVIENEENGKESKIMITDKVGLTIQQPPYDVLEEIDFKNIENINERKFFIETILKCIVNVFDENQVYNRSDFSKQEISEFVDSMTQSQLEKIGKMLESPPKLSYEISETCSCGNTVERTLKGINDFF